MEPIPASILAQLSPALQKFFALRENLIHHEGYMEGASESGVESPVQNRVTPVRMTAIAGRSRNRMLTRGIPDQLIEDAFKALSPHTPSATEIAQQVERSAQIKLAKGSLSRGIRRLEAKGWIVRVGDTFAYQYTKKDVPTKQKRKS